MSTGTSAGRLGPLRERRATTLAAVATAVAGWTAGGLPGGLVGLLTVVTAVAVSPVYAVAVGQIGILAVLGPEPGLESLALVEGTLLSILLADVVDGRPGRSAVAVAALAVGGAGALAWLATRSLEPLWLVALAVPGVCGSVGYTLHRVTVVRFEITHE